MKMKVASIPIDLLELSEREQNPARVRELVACIRQRGLEAIPPIAIIETRDGGIVWDGHHRVLAAKAAGFTSVPTVNRLAMRGADAAAYRRMMNRWRAEGCMKWRATKK